MSFQFIVRRCCGRKEHREGGGSDGLCVQAGKHRSAQLVSGVLDDDDADDD